MKKAVLLLNLGSPRSCKTDDVRVFLREFLGDPCVLDMNPVLRWLLLNCIILPRRPAHSAKAYKQIWTPEGSPLLAHTERLRVALQALLSEDVPVFAGMRYGEPSTAAAIRAAMESGAEEVVVLPQYPHYAMSSHGTAVALAKRLFEELAPRMRVRIQEPFYDAPGYIEALVESARPWLQQPFDKLLFSFHGIPLRHLRREIPNYPDCAEALDCNADAPPEIRARDYRHQCFATAEAFAAAAGLPREKFTVAFQSRLGRTAWVRPYTDETLRRLAQSGTRRLLVICPAFTADCLETIHEINIEGRETFLEAGGESFEQIPCLNSHPAYVRFLAGEV
ncbi:MAG: ferrochelatase [Puniceicoccales bacterium]|jgi:ferrochelatase|nr:ferrochelatase [Puniceicoccales bacterium]